MRHEPRDTEPRERRRRPRRLMAGAALALATVIALSGCAPIRAWRAESWTYETDHIDATDGLAIYKDTANEGVNYRYLWRLTLRTREHNSLGANQEGRVRIKRVGVGDVKTKNCAEMDYGHECRIYQGTNNAPAEPTCWFYGRTMVRQDGSIGGSWNTRKMKPSCPDAG